MNEEKVEQLPPGAIAYLDGSARVASVTPLWGA